MGLDMYLTAKRWMGSTMEESDSSIADELDAVHVPGKGHMKIEYIECKAMYWRKANAIHYWFVRECQEGVDECQESYVSPSKIKKLIDICGQILKDRELAPKLLPTGTGFFFGPIEYGEWYFENIQITFDTLTEIMAEPGIDGWTFSYRSSW